MLDNTKPPKRRSFWGNKKLSRRAEAMRVKRLAERKPILRRPTNASTIKHVLIGTILKIKGLEWMVMSYLDTPGTYTLRSIHSGEEHFTSRDEMGAALASGMVEVIPPEWAVKEGAGV